MLGEVLSIRAPHQTLLNKTDKLLMTKWGLECLFPVRCHVGH